MLNKYHIKLNELMVKAVQEQRKTQKSERSSRTV